jgi:hypothetical protein
VDGALGVGVELGVGLELGLEAGALGRGGRRSAGSVAAGSATPTARTGVEEIEAGAGSGAALVLELLDLWIAKAAAKATTTITAAIATRPREPRLIRRLRASWSPERGTSGLF